MDHLTWYSAVATGWKSWSDGSIIKTKTDPTTDITHGRELVAPYHAEVNVGPSALTSAPLDNLTAPDRGYYRIDTPEEFAIADPYVYNNDSSNHGGTLYEAMTIDGFIYPAGTKVIQFCDFPTAFYAVDANSTFLFRGCRFRRPAVGGESLFNDYLALSGWQAALHYCDIGGDSKEVSTGSFLKFLGGSGHRVFRCYISNVVTGIQPNAHDVDIIETLIEELIFCYGELGPSGNGDAAHLNGISIEGGVHGLRILRCKILVPSPDGTTGLGGSSPGQVGYGTQPGQIGYGDGSNPGRLLPQTDCIALFNSAAINHDITVSDCHLGGAGYCVYLGGPGSYNIRWQGNEFTTRWWTNGGNFGAATDTPGFGTNGNISESNTWADDYGDGGDGCTRITDRQYPTGNGPRKGTLAF